MSKFYIGQKIVAIKDHSQGIFKKGDEFVVLGSKNICCGTIINIGITTEYYHMLCDCNYRYENNGIHWCHDDMFAPIELSNTTFEDVIKQLEPCLN